MLYTMDNTLVVGSGFFSQNIYIPILIKKKCKLFIYDERINLLKKTANYYNLSYLENLDKKTLNKYSIKSVFICYERFRSFELCKFFLKNKINVFAEKPVSESASQLRKLDKIATKNKLIFISSFQRNFYYSSFIFKKKILSTLKKTKKNYKIISLFHSGNFRFNCKTLVRTNEKIRIHKKKNFKTITRMVFLNRYWHIINYICFLLNINKNNIDQLKINDLKKKSLTEYIIKLKFKNIHILLNLTPKNFKKNVWSEKYIFSDNNKLLFNLKLPAPMNFIDGTLKNKFNHKFFDVFQKQIEFFFRKIKKQDYKNLEIKNCLNQLKFLESNIFNVI